MTETSSDPSQQAPVAPSRKKWLIQNLQSLATALIIVLAIRNSLIEAFKIPSGSMIPTLFIGDHIFVNKFAYGFKFPFVDYFTDAPLYLIKRDPPKRGDIIVFKFPRDESLYYIKRVVGVPGDTIEIRDKALYVNQKKIERETVPPAGAEAILKPLESPEYTLANSEVYTERLGHVSHTIIFNKDEYLGENHGPITVPAESLFVMGDNRDRSNDSRFWGFVPYKNVKGKALVIWLSLWFSFTDGQRSFHPERIGTVLN
jgi:signal peptidase I